MRPPVVFLIVLAALLFVAPAARAVDCAKAQSATEKGICADPQALVSDNAMGAAFTALLAAEPKPQHKLLVDDQASWLEERDIDCGSGADGQPLAGAALSQCLIGETDARRRFLAGLPAEGPGAPAPIVPQLFEGADNSIVVALRFAAPQTPGEKRFNAEVDAALKKVHLATDENDFSDDLTMQLDYASPKLLSANVDGTDQNPKLTHPMPYNFEINVDLSTGRKLSFDDAFAADALPALQQLCLPQVLAYTNPESVPGSEASASADVTNARIDDVRTAVGDLNQWRFGAGKARIVFRTYVERTESTCSLDYAKLRGLIKPDFPLPT